MKYRAKQQQFGARLQRQGKLRFRLELNKRQGLHPRVQYYHRQEQEEERP